MMKRVITIVHDGETLQMMSSIECRINVKL